MRTEVVRDWSILDRLRPEWDSLLGDSCADSLFLTWDWIRTWADLVRGTVLPLVVVVRDDLGRLAGIAPFYLTDLWLVRALSFRTLRVMGDYPTGSEYPDWILRRDLQDRVAAAVVTALSEIEGVWDCLWMPNVAPATGARERLTTAFQQAGWYYHVRPTDFAYFDLPTDAETYRRNLSGNKRQQLRAELRRIMDRGGASIVRCETADQFPRFIEALFDLHYRRRLLAGEVGSFRRKPTEAVFYRRFGRVALEHQILALYGLEHAGALKAVQYGYVYGGVYHQMQEGFDPDYEKGAGNVLRWKTIQALIAEGVRGYDFLGEMTEHKRRWGAKLRLGSDVFAGRRTVKNALLFARTIWPAGRYLRQAFVPHDPSAPPLV
jgi:CelD/BcsL family acetyltransferase involved in cellulose biosynthesis